MKHVWIYAKSGSDIEMDMEPASYDALINDFVGFVSNSEVNCQGIKVYGSNKGDAVTMFIELGQIAAIIVEGVVE